MDIQVLEDVISETEQRILYDYVNNFELQWKTVENITGGYGGTGKLNFPAKVHPQFYCKNDFVKSIIDKIQLTIAMKMNLDFIQSYRWKINWTQPINNEYNPMDLLHYDRINDHIAAVYYINDSTGNTFIYDNIEGNDVQNFKSNFNKINPASYILLKSVSPKMGRCVAFDGRLAHYGDYPKSESRYIINFNFAVKDRDIKKLL